MATAPIANLHAIRAADLRHGEVDTLDLDHGQVGLWVWFRLGLIKRPTVGQRDTELLRALRLRDYSVRMCLLIIEDEARANTGGNRRR